LSSWHWNGCNSHFTNGRVLGSDVLAGPIFAGKRDQLWNVIPASIQTAEEQQAVIERLKRNLGQQR
jgi:hypothetical protein